MHSYLTIFIKVQRTGLFVGKVRVISFQVQRTVISILLGVVIQDELSVATMYHHGPNAGDQKNFNTLNVNGGK
jgi:hypothetical protein